ncbi:MAG: VOC family protein [Rhodobacter sp.]|nr:VOC family protein [Rhodobacter sp.]
MTRPRVALDHLVVSAETLAAGVAHVEAALGVEMAPGGTHAAMGTHNRLLGLGPAYLEVIAIDPDAPPLARPRWFDLDNFSGPPRLTHWVAAADDLAAALAVAPDGSGTATPLARSDLRWTMAVPADGRLPFDGAFPALIEWHGDAHPRARLPDRGCRLAALQIAHPRVDALRGALAQLADIPQVSVADGPEPRLQAELDTPSGRRVLE